jgi:ribosomal protein S18 acetylase RimI-like enzyme
MHLQTHHINQVNSTFETVYKLYKDSFPSDERRSKSQLLKCFNNKRYNLLGFWNNKTLIGLLEYWDFTTFIFIEHIAVKKKYRGQSIGKNIMKTMTEKEIPIYLEIELIDDENTQRRFNFYKHLKFKILPVKYFQPSYSANKQSIEMHFLALNHSINANITEIIATIHNTVY